MKYFFTYGSAMQFPYHDKDYVVVEGADNEKEAVEAYRKKYPDYNPGVVNCAFWYDENRWNDILKNHTGGRERDRIII